jgi:hypothetical protein
MGRVPVRVKLVVTRRGVQRTETVAATRKSAANPFQANPEGSGKGRQFGTDARAVREEDGGSLPKAATPEEEGPVFLGGLLFQFASVR